MTCIVSDILNIQKTNVNDTKLILNNCQIQQPLLGRIF